MKRKRYTDEQIAYALRQAEAGTPIKEALDGASNAAPPVSTIPCQHQVAEIRTCEGRRCTATVPARRRSPAPAPGRGPDSGPIRWRA